MSEHYKIVYSYDALNDLKKIYSYIAFDLKVPQTAKNHINKIRKQINSLDHMPMRHSVVDWEPWKSMHMHKVSVDNYIVFYTVSQTDLIVTVIRIFYGGRNIEDIIKEL